MRALLIIGVIAGSALHAHADGKGPVPRAPQYDATRRALVEKAPEPRALSKAFAIGPIEHASFRGASLRRAVADEKSVQLQKQLAISRITELDPKHVLLSEQEWTELRAAYLYDTKQVTNKAEDIEVAVQDPASSLNTARQFEEIARGRMATKLAAALKGQTPSPAALLSTASKLAEQLPALRSPFEVEMLIADTRKIVPTLAGWDFRKNTDGRTFRGDRPLPASTQAIVSRVGYRTFRDTNVLFANHMYKDSLVMIDALTALGLAPENARFVATPYPFDKRVRMAIEHRGVKVQASPYSVEETKKHVAEAINALLERASKNNGPIVVFDDGGMATEIIARDHPTDLHRFRIIEITKAGERIAKKVLPPALGADPRDHRYLDFKQRAAMRAKWIEIHGTDEESGERAAKRWDTLEHAARFNPPLRNPDHALPAHAYGFAYYTYSNTPYKRDVMTPLYTEQVNSSLFGSLERGNGQGPIKPINQRVTIVGGGAMGIAAGRELRDKGFEVTFVDPDPERIKVLAGEGFALASLHDGLPGRGIVLEMSGMRHVIGINELGLIEDGAIVAHGSSKDNPFDMDALRSIASTKTDWPEHEGQRSASYRFDVMGMNKTLHFPGDGFTISHGGKAQNVPLDKFVPELDRLLNLGINALHDRPVTYYPMFTATEAAMDPTATAKP